MAPPRCCAQVQYDEGVQCLKNRRPYRLTCKLHQHLEDYIYQQLDDSGSWTFRNIFTRGKNWMAPKRSKGYSESSSDGSIDYEYCSLSSSSTSSSDDNDDEEDDEDDLALLSGDEEVLHAGKPPKQQERATPSFADLCRTHEAIISRLRAVPGSVSTSSPHTFSQVGDADLNEEEYMMSGALIDPAHPPVFPSNGDEITDSDVDDADFADLYKAENAILGRLEVGHGPASVAFASSSSSSDRPAVRNLDEDHI